MELPKASDLRKESEKRYNELQQSEWNNVVKHIIEAKDSGKFKLEWMGTLTTETKNKLKELEYKVLETFGSTGCTIKWENDGFSNKRLFY